MKSSNNWFKKSLMIAAVSALLMSLLAACGQSGSNGGNSAPQGGTGNKEQGAKEEKIELRFAWWGSQGRHDRTLQAIAKFEEKYQHIKVIPEYSSWDGYWEKLSTQVSAGNAPDVMQMSILYIKEYSEREVLADLNPFVGSALKVEDLNADVLSNQGTIGGKLTGIPVADNASVLLVNNEMFDQAKINKPEKDSTWEELFAISRELKAALGDNVYGLFDSSSSLEAFMYYLFSKGDKLYSEDNRLGYNDENLKEWMSMWETARKEGIAPPANITASALPLSNADPNKDALLKGTVAMMGPTWIAAFPAYQSVMTDNVDMISYPHAEQTGSVLQTAMFFSASAKSKQQEAAALLIDFLVNSEEAADILETERGLPENKKVREYLAPKFTDRDKKMIAMLEHVSQSNPAWYDAGPKGAGEVTALFEKVIQKHQFGKATIDEAVKEFRVEADKIFARNNG